MRCEAFRRLIAPEHANDAVDQPHGDHMHVHTDADRRIGAPQAVEAGDHVVQRLQPQPTHVLRRAGGEEAALLHRLPVLVREAALAVVLLGSGREVGCVLLGVLDESASGLGDRLELEGCVL